MKFIGIIPARYASSRFPGKPLVDMKGKPMIQRVYEQVSLVLDHICVATDHPDIEKAVRAFGGNVVRSLKEHPSGTDRCREAYHLLGGKEDIIINIQGDEPFIKPEQIRAIMSCFDNPKTEIATLARAFESHEGWEALANPNSPKVILDSEQNAIAFSRSVIPYLRGVDCQEWLSRHTFYKHIGMYAFKADVLDAITALPQSSLEVAESLEQMRWIENGYSICVAITTQETIGIDTPEDMARAIALLP